MRADMQLTAAATRHKVEESLAKTRQVLDNNKHPVLAGQVSHRYLDKMTLAEFLTRCSLSAVFAGLSGLGVSEAQFERLREWSGSQAVTLRLRSEEKCVFARQETRRVESKTQHVVESSMFGTSKSKVVTTVTDYIWEFSVSYWLEAYRGTGSGSRKEEGDEEGEDCRCLLIQTRTSSCEITTATDQAPRVEHRLPAAEEVAVTWLFQHLRQVDTSSSSSPSPLQPSFHIDRAAEHCFTPRRNSEVEAALAAYRGLGRWCEQVHAYFTESVFPQSPDRTELDLEVIRADTVFVPVLPVLLPGGGRDRDSAGGRQQALGQHGHAEEEEDEEVDSPTLGVSDTNLFLLEQHRSLAAQCEAVARVLPAGSAQRSLISAAEGSLLVTLLHVRDILGHYRYGVDYLEDLLREQLTGAIGKVITARDFSQYMKYHNAKVLRAAYQPRPFCYSVRRSACHAPEGGLFLEETGGDMAEAIYTLVSQRGGGGGGGGGGEGGGVRQLLDDQGGGGGGGEGGVAAGEREFSLSAATTVKFTGSTYVHAHMSHGFENERAQCRLQLRAEARQFSGFIVMIGSLPSPTTFDPRHAFICQNKDEFSLPLQAEMIPSAKTFRDSIESLSPEQRRFATAYRGMQLSSTVFAVVVVQIKPQLERVLHLPPDSLTKEIKLTQDLMQLFIKYQIPSDLLSYDSPGGGAAGYEQVSVRERLEAVRGHVSAMQEMIAAAKQEELQERRQQSQYHDPFASVDSGSMDLLSAPFSPARNNMMGGGMMFGSASTSSSAHMAFPQHQQQLQCQTQSFGGGGGPPGGASGGGRGGGGGGAFGFSTAPPPPPSVASSAPASRFLNQATPSSRSLPMTLSPSESASASNENHTSVDTGPSGYTNAVTDNNSLKRKSPSSSRHLSDVTALPNALNERFEALDKEGAVRPVVLSVGPAWQRRRQQALLAGPSSSSPLLADEQKTEKTAAFDLLDALSRSGGLTLADADLHVVLMSTHCFDKTLMDTIVQKNTNPIEKMEQSTLVMASVLHGLSVEEMAQESQHDRLREHAALLFEEEEEEKGQV